MFKFPDVQKNIINYIQQKELIIDDKVDSSDIQIGGLFDKDAFNKKLDKIYSNIVKRKNIEDKIKELKNKSSIPNPNEMTVNQFISAILLDTYDMFYELYNIKIFSRKNINTIIDKNYRRITLYILILLLVIIYYYIISIKSYLVSDDLDNK